ncbi:AlbA family DNA-binding domain-containing protein [Aquibacillus kalidii]|uniref:AlbA family DNA-binding domain-containing protein n=1 Tax=Aquibacillus kalidii TaxID=2762597 RepID=UPI001645D3ED|nr:ATP-binding protein [Aquibacillus kalidii]
MGFKIGNQSFLEAFDTDSNQLDIATFQSLMENYYGETNELDFKAELIEETKLAKLMIAMANSGGGVIVFGVEDEQNKPVGIQLDKDITDFQRKVSNYLPDNLIFDSQLIRYDDNDLYGDFKNKEFMIVYIPKQNRYIPFISKKESNDIKINKIYIRKNTSVEEANNSDLENMITLRIHETYSDLSDLDLGEHISQLKVLYESIPRLKTSSAEWAKTISSVTNFSIFSTTTKNEYYPEESFDKYMSGLIEKKKRKIEKVIEVNDIE